MTSLVYAKEKDVLISGSHDQTLRVWSMSSYQCVRVVIVVEVLQHVFHVFTESVEVFHKVVIQDVLVVGSL